MSKKDEGELMPKPTGKQAMIDKLVAESGKDVAIVSHDGVRVEKNITPTGRIVDHDKHLTKTALENMRKLRPPVSEDAQKVIDAFKGKGKSIPTAQYLAQSDAAQRVGSIPRMISMDNDDNYSREAMIAELQRAGVTVDLAEFAKGKKPVVVVGTTSGRILRDENGDTIPWHPYLELDEADGLDKVPPPRFFDFHRENQPFNIKGGFAQGELAMLSAFTPGFRTTIRKTNFVQEMMIRQMMSGKMPIDASVTGMANPEDFLYGNEVDRMLASMEYTEPMTQERMEKLLGIYKTTSFEDIKFIDSISIMDEPRPRKKDLPVVIGKSNGLSKSARKAQRKARRTNRG